MRINRKLLVIIVAGCCAFAELALGQAQRTCRVTQSTQLRPTVKPLSPEKPPSYERDETYWQERYQQVVKVKLSEFNPPKIGATITLIQRIGGPIRGEIQALSEDSVTVDKTTFKRSQLTSETCAEIFAADWAIAKGKEIVSAERTEYERQEDEKWQKAYAIKKAQADAISSAISSAQEDKHYESAIKTMEDAISKNPEAMNIQQARSFLESLKNAYAEAIEKEKRKQESAALAAKAFTSRNNLALYFLNRVATPYQSRNSRTGGLNTIQGNVRSSDVMLLSENAWVKFEVVISHNGEPVGVTKFDLRFVKNFGRWEFDEYTCSNELAWSDEYVRWLIKDLGL
jgi:hypothetical protein